MSKAQQRELEARIMVLEAALAYLLAKTNEDRGASTLLGYVAMGGTRFQMASRKWRNAFEERAATFILQVETVKRFLSKSADLGLEVPLELQWLARRRI